MKSIISEGTACFSLVHLNVQGIGDKLNLLELFLDEVGSTDILCVTEHFVKSSLCDRLSLSGWITANSFGRESRSRGGVAIFCRNNLFSVCPEIDTLSVETHCEIASSRLSSFSVTVISIYRSPKGDFHKFLTIVESILVKIDLCEKFIICSNFNENFNISDYYSDAFCDLLSSYGFRRTVFEPTRGKICLDNIFLNFGCSDCRARVHEVSFSDHRAQRLTMRIPGESRDRSIRVFRPRTVRAFNEFYGFLENIDFNVHGTANQSVNENFKHFHDVFLDAYERCFPLKAITREKLRVGISEGWYNDRLRALRDDLNLVSGLYDRYGTERLKLHKRRLKTRYKMEIRNAKIKHNDQIIAKSNNKVRTMWTMIDQRRGVTRGQSDIQVDVETLSEYFHSVPHRIAGSVDKGNIDVETLFSKEIRSGLNFSFREVSFIEVRDIVSSLKSSTSRDFYDLSVDLIKRNINTIIYTLTKLINGCIRENVFPDCLKIAKIIPLFKGGDKSAPDNYRPISVLSVFSKILEKVMCIQIVEYFERNQLFSSSQFGFRKKKSTTDAILSIYQFVLEYFESGECTLSLFLDLTKAFDCVPHAALLAKLRRYGLCESSCRLVQSFLTDRLQTVFVNNKWSQKTNNTIGVPQGSILGLILFLIFINDFPDFMNLVHNVLFADDTNISVSCNDMNMVRELFAGMREDALKWFSGNGLCQ